MIIFIPGEEAWRRFKIRRSFEEAIGSWWWPLGCLLLVKNHQDHIMIMIIIMIVIIIVICITIKICIISCIINIFCIIIIIIIISRYVQLPLTILTVITVPDCRKRGKEHLWVFILIRACNSISVLLCVCVFVYLRVCIHILNHLERTFNCFKMNIWNYLES